MPAVKTGRSRSRNVGRPPRAPGVPLPGIGGYAIPRGPYGEGGFPGSTPAAEKTKTQARPEGGRGLRQLTARGNQAEWAELPRRRAGGDPSQPRARTGHETEPEHRMIPVLGYDGLAPIDKIRNSTARRVYAIPGAAHAYRPSPNPGKTGAVLDGTSQFHPGQQVYGHPDGKPVPGMPSQPGDPYVIVSSRFVSHEGAQEGYAMNRGLEFAKGSVAAFPAEGYRGSRHLRGGRLSGERYTGDVRDQQMNKGEGQGSYGINRPGNAGRRRPVSFRQPGPWTANYYDVPADQGSQAPDMIHRSPGPPGGKRRTGRPAKPSPKKTGEAPHHEVRRQPGTRRRR